MIEQNLCMSCYKPINNPICESCKIEELLSLLAGYPIFIKTKIEVIKKIRRHLQRETLENDALCIICGKNTLSICSNCFMLIAAKAFKDVDLNREIMGQFLYSFGRQISN